MVSGNQPTVPTSDVLLSRYPRYKYCQSFVRLLIVIFFDTGALWTSLAPTAVALALYFCFADLVLIGQCSYYNAVNARRRSRIERHARSARHPSAETQETDTTAVEDPSEHDPLLGHEHPRRSRSDSTGLPGSHRRHSMRHRESTLDPLTRIVTGEDETPDSNPWLHNTLSLVAVWVVGAAGWFISYKMGAWDVEDGLPDGGDNTISQEPQAVIGMILGYFSAICYLWYVSSPVVSAHSLGVTTGLKKLTNSIALESLRSSRITVRSLAKVLPCCFSCSRSRATSHMEQALSPTLRKETILSEPFLGFWARSGLCWKTSSSLPSSDSTRRNVSQRCTIPPEELALRLHEANDTHLLGETACFEDRNQRSRVQWNILSTVCDGCVLVTLVLSSAFFFNFLSFSFVECILPRFDRNGMLNF